MPCDLQEHAFQILPHFPILEAHNSNPRPAQELAAFRITVLSHLMVVRGAIQFDAQFFSRAVEIQNVVIDTMLASKLAPEQLATLKVSPEKRLGRGQLRSELSA